jgi:hypothetical protein
MTRALCYWFHCRETSRQDQLHCRIGIRNVHIVMNLKCATSPKETRPQY